MARYGTFTWGSGPVYGTQPTSELDVEPFVARAIDYRRIDLSWTPPLGSFTRFRLIRNQGNIPEHEEDGVKLIDTADLTAVSNLSLYRDGVDNVGEAAVELVPGGFVYYAIWLLLDDGWYAASYAYTLLAQDHSVPLGEGDDRTHTTHERLMDLLPRVYTTDSGNPLDEVDRDSDLWTFLSGFSYTLDELMTYIDLLVPDAQALNYSPERLALKARELGLAPEPRPSTRYQRRLVKEARRLFSSKGTLSGVSNFVEAMTGFAPVLTESPNLLLTYQDGTFVNSTGLWEQNAGCALTAIDTVVPPTAEANSIDKFWTAEVVVSAADAYLSYGRTSPTTLGVPVSAETEYTVSAYMQRSDAANVTFFIDWHDFRGALLSTSSSTAAAIGTSWSKLSYTATSPVGATYATLRVAFSAATTVNLDLVQFSASTITDYYEPRELDIFLLPSKTNFVENPSFESDTTGWTITAASSASFVDDGPAGVNTGSSVLQVVGTTPGTTSVSYTAVGRPLGVWHTCSIYGRSLSGPIEVVFRANTDFSDSTPSATTEVTYTLTSEWQRMHATVSTCIACVAGLPGADGADPEVTLTIEAETNGETLQFDAAQIEELYEPSDYFDGTYTYAGALWAGTAHGSASYKYINKLPRIEQLRNELKNFLPMNTPYRVRTHSGVEFTGVA